MSMSLKGLSKASGDLNPIVPAGRYVGSIEEVKFEEWPGHEGGQKLQVKVKVTDSYDEMDNLPTWFEERGITVMDFIYIPNEDAHWYDMSVNKIKNLYMGADVEVAGDEIDPEQELVGANIGVQLMIDEGGMKDTNAGKKHFDKRNNIKSYFVLG